MTIKPRMIPTEGLDCVTGSVQARYVDLGPHFIIVWNCPFCREQISMDAVEYMIDFCIEDARTALAHCSEIPGDPNYAIIAPKLMPEGLAKLFGHARG